MLACVLFERKPLELAALLQPCPQPPRHGRACTPLPRWKKGGPERAEGMYFGRAHGWLPSTVRLALQDYATSAAVQCALWP